MQESDEVEVKTVEHSMPLDVLCDLISRFVINVPDPAKENLIRICFQIELAHWYYLDFYVNGDANTTSKLKGCSYREFAAHVFQHLPFLQGYFPRLNEVLDEWREYKLSVPTYGAIMLSEGNTHVLLVQSYWAKASWGFPKGKVNQEEEPLRCAIREVHEETGFDISNYTDPECYFEQFIRDQKVRLYIVQNIPRTTKFEPKTRCEIKACEWFAINDLPNHKKDETPRIKLGINPNAFFMVMPFIKKLKHFCQTGRVYNNLNATINQSNKSSTRRNRTKSENELSQNKRQQARTRTESDEHNKSNSKNGCSKKLFNETTTNEFIFSAPSWLNFKFDKAAIMECIP